MTERSELLEPDIPTVLSWDEMYGRENCARDVDASKLKLRAVIAPYRLQPAKPGGLTNAMIEHLRHQECRAKWGSRLFRGLKRTLNEVDPQLFHLLRRRCGKVKNV